MIAILCPTRGRPEQHKKMVESADLENLTGVHNATVTGYVQMFSSWSNEDKDIYKERGTMATHIDILPDMMPTAQKWNLLAERAMSIYGGKNKLFMLGADDMVFETKGWAKALIDHYNGLDNKIHVYHLQDSRDENGTPHPIVTREYIEAMGYFLPPIFLHWFVDSWTVEIAKANGCFTHLRDYKLTHDKPSDQGNPDETHSRIRQFGWSDRDRWVNDKCQHFLRLEKDRLKFKLNGMEYIGVELCQMGHD